MQITKDRQYLQHLERIGEGKINWDAWERIVEQTRNELGELLRNYNIKKTWKCNRKNVYGYNNNGELVNEWKCNIDCANEFKVTHSVIHNYSKTNKIINGYLISREKLTKDKAFALYRNALENGHVYNRGKTKPNKTVYQYNKDGKMIGVFESLNQWCKCNEILNQVATIRNRLVNNTDILVKGKMITYNFYDEIIAKEIYNEKTRNNR